jgi:uncharacterized tellurite resistance protein B-like protein
MSFDELIPEGLSPTSDEAEIILELSYLVTAADGKLTDEELEAFGTLAARLQGKASITPPQVDAIVERYAGAVDWSDIESRVKEIAPKLPKDLHAAAYRLALGLAFVDHDPSEAEDRIHKLLGDTLGIREDRRAAIARQVTIDGGRARAKPNE